MKSTAAIAAILVTLAGSAARAQGQPPPPACEAAPFRAFDFWVGRWRVSPYAKQDKEVARSVIEKLYGGCAIRENWMPKVANADGGSLSSYVADEKQWRQTWVDSSGGRVEFTGGWNGKAMVLTGLWPQPGHPAQHTRMTYTREADGSVRQLGESSDDGGKSWQPSFDFLYRKE